MIIYNVTVKIDSQIEAEWLSWMKEIHIPEVIATGCFSDHKMMRLLDPPPDEHGATYAVQYFCHDMKILNRYWRDFAPSLQAAHTDRYKGRFGAFRTIMELV